MREKLQKPRRNSVDIVKIMALAVYEAIYNSHTNHKEFDGALNAVFYMAHDHMNHMKALRDEAYVLRKKEKFSTAEGDKE